MNIEIEWFAVKYKIHGQFFSVALQPNLGPGCPTGEASRSHTQLYIHTTNRNPLN